MSLPEDETKETTNPQPEWPAADLQPAQDARAPEMAAEPGMPDDPDYARRARDAG